MASIKSIVANWMARISTWKIAFRMLFEPAVEYIAPSSDKLTREENTTASTLQLSAKKKVIRIPGLCGSGLPDTLWKDAHEQERLGYNGAPGER